MRARKENEMADGTRRDERRVLLLDGRYQDYGLERAAIERVGGTLTLNRALPTTEEEVLAIPGLANAEVLLVELAPVTRAVLEAASSARAVIRYGTGFDNVDVEAARERGISAENIAGYAAESVSEHAMALLLAVSRRLVEHVDLVRAGEWRSGDIRLRPVGLSGHTLGIVGLGAIGKALSARARGFGLTIVGYDPVADPASIGAFAELMSLDELLERSDYVSLHLPLMPETAGLFDEETLAKMKPGAVLINTSRGGLVDEEALIRSLDSGRLSFAALDVVAQEPLPRDHPFRSHPAVLLTPHVAFWSDQAELLLRTAVAQKAVQALTEKGTS